MSKHTPGPWHTHETARGNTEIVAKSTAVANVVRNANTEKAASANAHLIAAAPELLDALRELTIAAEAAGWDIGDNASVLNAARAAIAKAEGGAP